MKVLLISPFSESHYFVPPVGLGYVAAALRKKGFEVELLDGVREKLTLQGLSEKISKNPPEVIGISFFSCDSSVIKAYVRAIREISAEIIIILGGPHVTGVREQIFEDFPHINFAFVGETETHLPVFLEELQNDSSQKGKLQNEKDYSRIPGLVWKNGSKVQVNPAFLEENLDKMGIPAWDLMDPRTYPKAPQGAVFRNWPIGTILTSRGCPYNCTYCAGKLTTGQRIRKRSIGNIMEEMELLYNHFGVREIHIIDDTFTTDRELVRGFCRGIKEKGFKISLTFPNGVRLNNLDEEILSLLKEAGCYAMSVGIESGNAKILKDMRKGLTLGLIEEKVNLIQKMGIDVNGFFILGYPTETKETILETIRFSQKLPLKRAHFSTFLPLPGTEGARIAQELGLIKKNEWDRLFYTDAPCPPPGMSSKELKSLQRKAFLEFYLRPKQLIWLAKEIKSFGHFKSLARRAKDYALGRF